MHTRALKKEANQFASTFVPDEMKWPVVEVRRPAPRATVPHRTAAASGNDSTNVQLGVVQPCAWIEQWEGGPPPPFEGTLAPGKFFLTLTLVGMKLRMLCNSLLLLFLPEPPCYSMQHNPRQGFVVVDSPPMKAFLFPHICRTTTFPLPEVSGKCNGPIGEFRKNGGEWGFAGENFRFL